MGLHWTTSGWPLTLDDFGRIRLDTSTATRMYTSSRLTVVGLYRHVEWWLHVLGLGWPGWPPQGYLDTGQLHRYQAQVQNSSLTGRYQPSQGLQQLSHPDSVVKLIRLTVHTLVQLSLSLETNKRPQTATPPPLSPSSRNKLAQQLKLNTKTSDLLGGDQKPGKDHHVYVTKRRYLLLNSLRKSLIPKSMRED